MKITCTNLGESQLLTESITHLGQIYRFDQFRISIEGISESFRFDIPSSEWLERFTELLNSSPPTEAKETLRGSGWFFNAGVTEEFVFIRVYDISRQQDAEIKLTHEEARRLHRVVFDALVNPFYAQGGKIQDLRDIDNFRIRQFRQLRGHQLRGHDT